ncbi:ABC transporter permease [Pseudogracilibacillus sp. SE30717A]|uniref:ABC transporter permease n=1 Tax=Pseudogracilibacillus sp. SE30717A TaxID=3098293 RepID=UPI00300E1962
MSGIFITKIKWLIRNPWTFILMTFMSILFALITGGANGTNKITVPAYTELNQIKNSSLAEMIDEKSIFKIDWVTDKRALEKKILSGKHEFGIVFNQDDYDILVGINSPNVVLFENTVKNAYHLDKQFNQLEQASGEENVKEIIENNSFFNVKSQWFHGQDTFLFDGNLHTLFGFSLFFVIYTIAYSVFQILLEKRTGVWDRVILSPVRKWEMYVANFLYSFLIGYVQVVIVFFIFRFIVKVDFHGMFWQTLLLLIPYVLAIVALSIFIIGTVNTIQQFNAVIPIVSVSMAMIGGAFWPLDIVDSTFMLQLSKLIPITYGMEVLYGVTLYGYNLEQILYPVSILLLMTVVLTGLGIHLMERNYIS